MIYLAADPKDPTQSGDKLYRMVGSTSNPGRKGGGTAHYRIDKHPIHFLCKEVEAQLVEHLKHVQVDSEIVPLVRASYTDEVAAKLGQARPDERIEMEKMLKAIDEEEARVLRLYAAGIVTEENWKNLWAEWQDKRQTLRTNLELLDQRCETYINDLDDALTIIEKLGILYETLSQADQRELLRNVVERVVVNTEGKIDRVEYLPPFAYLQEVRERVNEGTEAQSGTLAGNETDGCLAACSRTILDCGQYRTRTYDLLDVNETLCQLS
ncbi:MAG: hypothetical protein OHK0046_08730 [Anaerolineae bacterium]